MLVQEPELKDPLTANVRGSSVCAHISFGRSAEDSLTTLLEQLEATELTNMNIVRVFAYEHNLELDGFFKTNSSSCKKITLGIAWNSSQQPEIDLAN